MKWSRSLPKWRGFWWNLTLNCFSRWFVTGKGSNLNWTLIVDSFNSFSINILWGLLKMSIGFLQSYLKHIIWPCHFCYENRWICKTILKVDIMCVSCFQIHTTQNTLNIFSNYCVVFMWVEIYYHFSICLNYNGVLFHFPYIICLVIL